MKRNMLLSAILVMAILAVAIYAAPFFQPAPAATAASQAPSAPLAPAIAASPQFASVGDMESVFQTVYDQVNPSVVAIDVVSAPTTGTPNTPGLPDSHPAVPGGLSSGSGFIWDNQGNIVTNNHVVAGARQISVTFADDSVLAAKLVGADPDSDLAVIKVDAPAGLLRPVQIGNSNQVKVGQVAIALGSPFGEQNTMTTGIISALGRSLSAGGGLRSGGSFSIPDVIQTDAAINPGNSGGVLLNVQGQVIGVTSAIESPVRANSGVGFAIPSAIVQRVVPAIIKTGKYEHPYIGISGTTLTPDIAKAMGLKADQRGALISTITAGGPAEKAGLRGSNQTATVGGLQMRIGGDVIIAIDGNPIKSFDALISYLSANAQANQTVTMTILRDAKEQAVQLTLSARPATQRSQ